MAVGSLNIDTIAKKIEKELKDKANKFLKDKLAPEIQEDLVRRAVGEVYGVYNPVLYERRGTLKQTNNYKVETGDLTVSITPVAEFNRVYGGFNEGDELGGFMNFGRGWHGYVMGNGWRLPSGGPLNVPLPRSYLTNAAMDWNWKIQDEINKEFGEWADCVTAKVTLGED